MNVCICMHAYRYVPACMHACSQACRSMHVVYVYVDMSHIIVILHAYTFGLVLFIDRLQVVINRVNVQQLFVRLACLPTGVCLCAVSVNKDALCSHTPSLSSAPQHAPDHVNKSSGHDECGDLRG